MPVDPTAAIALVSASDGGRGEQIAAAAFAGAVAMVRITEDLDHDGEPLLEVGHTLEGMTLRAAAVDRPTGDALRAAIGQEATLDVRASLVEDHVSHDVLGRIEGTGPGEVFVVAHYDSWHPSESAFDNALGVGALIALAARAAKEAPPSRSIVFLATSGEEQGLRGAIAWVDAHPERAADAELVLNLDVLWAAEGDFFVTATDDALRALAMEAARAEGLDPVDGGQPGLSSDHVPFVARGASAVWCARWPDRHYHTTEDTIDALDLDEAAAALRAQWRVLHASAW